MKRIGILFGQESTFPPALVERINSKDIDGVKAEFLKVGAVYDHGFSGYAVIIDRISHDIPFYRSYLKNAALHGAYVFNNPFWWSADDKFIDIAIAAKAGVAVPRTVLLPTKDHPPNTTSQSMRNMKFPIEWEEVFDYVGFPCFMKPFDGGGWRNVYKINSPEEFFHQYDQTADICMILQQGIEYESYYRCYGVGRRDVHIMPYAPHHPMHLRYVVEYPENQSLMERMLRDVIAINNALGYDLNTVEFAVKEGIPYAIDYMNPAPDCDINSVTPANFEWVVESVARFAIDCALEGRTLFTGNLHDTLFLSSK